MKNLLSVTLLSLFLLASVVPAQIATGGSYSLEKSVTATGGGTSSGGTFSLTGTSGQNIAGTTSGGSGFIKASGFWTPEQLVTTAASATISGQVKTFQGSGIRNVQIKLLDTNGGSRIVLTSSFGNFSFTNVEVGQTYILEITSKRYQFSNPTQFISFSDDLTDILFTADDR